MDKVQIYYTVLFGLNLFLAGYMHGKPKEGEHNAWVSLIATLLSIPIIGRIYGWW